MSVVGDFTVSASSFALAESLKAVPSVTAEFERLVAHSTDWVMPFLWIKGSDAEFEKFDEAIAGDSSVQTFEVTDSFSDSRLCKMIWSQNVARTVDTVLDHEGTILEATGQNDEWKLKVRFSDHDQLTTFHTHFQDDGEIVLDQLLSPTEPHSGEFALTAKQREALVAAYDAGYYESPRAVTASALAEEFGLSQQAFSERLHRGTAQLIKNALVTGEF